MTKTYKVKVSIYGMTMSSMDRLLEYMQRNNVSWIEQESDNGTSYIHYNHLRRFMNYNSKIIH